MLSNFFDRGYCDSSSAFSSVLFQLISFVYKITSVTLYVFLYNLQLCLICMEMQLMDNTLESSAFSVTQAPHKTPLMGAQH